MIMKSFKVSLISVLVVLLAAMLACSGSSSGGEGSHRPAQQLNQVASALPDQASGTIADNLPQPGQAAITLPAPVASGSGQEELKALVAAVQPNADGSVNLTITDAQLNKAIQAAQAAQQQSDSGKETLISNPLVKFSVNGILLTGDITQPVAAQLSVLFTPLVVNGVLQFEVVEASLGGKPIPAPLLKTAEETLNSTLGQAMSNLPPNISLNGIIMGEGTLTITGSVIQS